MTDLERQLTDALERLSVQYETEQRRHSAQAEALHEQVEALRRRVERQSAQSENLKEQVERLSGQVTRLTEGSGSSGVTYRGGGWR